jgi:hypothetical protein
LRASERPLRAFGPEKECGCGESGSFDPVTGNPVVGERTGETPGGPDRNALCRVCRRWARLGFGTNPSNHYCCNNKKGTNTILKMTSSCHSSPNTSISTSSFINTSYSRGIPINSILPISKINTNF